MTIFLHAEGHGVQNATLMGARLFPDTEAFRLALARHQHRREQGIPTLSVLVGPEGDAVNVWKNWTGSMGWPFPELATWPESGIGTPPGAVLYVGGMPEKDARQRGQRLSRAVARLMDQLAADPPEMGHAWAISVRREDAAAFLRDNAHTRAGAMFIEGMVELSRPTVSPAKPALPPRSPAIDTGPTISFLTRLGASPATAACFQTAAEACRAADATPAADEEENGDRARSAAERFLFQLLNDLPDTAGLFELNARLGFCFGPMRAEVDLFSPALGLAVEIDGFHHFREPENYRRDRRKDTLLQKQGYLVLRFLAGDAITRLEDILEEIRAAVAFRRVTR